MGDYVSHGLLKEEEVEKRLYQLSIASTASSDSCLVVLPTGLGKTVVALLVVASRVSRTGGKALILAPTKPLVDQHSRFFSSKSELPVEVLTGETRPDDREALWNLEGSGVLVATPQVVENDLLSGRASLDDVTTLIFDEAHRASGDYPYAWISEKHERQAEDPLRLGLTASPGNSEDDVKRICGELGLDAIEVRSESSPDVEPYVQRRVVEWVEVELPEELDDAAEHLRDILDNRLSEVKSMGFSVGSGSETSRKKLLNLQKRVQGRISDQNNPDGKLFRAASLVAECLKVRHAVDVLETQGPGPAQRYLDRVRKEARSSGGSKAAGRLSDDLKFKKAKEALKDTEAEFPKMKRLKEVLSREIDGDSRAIVFTNYRDTASSVVEELEGEAGMRPVRFVGQASKEGDEGLSQSEQADVIDRFTAGEHNVLVGTSVAEEGLDIPSTDLVVFYEPVASAIRSVQRKGRTGRSRGGRIVVLMTKGTKDEGVYWASKRREDEMETSMRRLSGTDLDEEMEGDGQSSLEKFEGKGSDGEKSEEREAGDGAPGEEEDPVVVADHREGKSGLLRSLDSMELRVRTEQLEVGDFVIGDRTVVERKSSADFVSSLVDGEGRLFRQAGEMAANYDRPVFLVEGEDLFTVRNVHPNAVRGALASLVLDFGVPVLRTEDADETAAMIRSLARREASEGRRKPHLHSGKSAETLPEQQVRLVSAIEGIGPNTAEDLLRHFGTVRDLAAADEEELAEVDGVGPGKAESVRLTLNAEYGDQ